MIVRSHPGWPDGNWLALVCELVSEDSGWAVIESSQKVVDWLAVTCSLLPYVDDEVLSRTRRAIYLSEREEKQGNQEQHTPIVRGVSSRKYYIGPLEEGRERILRFSARRTSARSNTPCGSHVADRSRLSDFKPEPNLRPGRFNGAALHLFRLPSLPSAFWSNFALSAGALGTSLKLFVR